MSDIVEGLVAVKMPSKFDDSIRIKLEDGEWYSASQEMADKIRKGATVKLKTERRGKSIFIEAVKELSFSEPAQKPSGGGGGYNRGGGGGGANNAAREASIHYQSSRKDAIEVLKLMQDAGLLKLGGKADLKVPVLMAKLDELTAGFLADIGTQGAVKRFAAEAGESDDFDPDGEVEEETSTDDDFPEGDDDDF